jgi:exopolyphosphatase/guanosine-5'-triphosphate,3'-diphosphate pyrophosphatase
MITAELSDCFAIIDIGSNSIRMVIYDEIARFPRIVIDEKAECHLAEGLAMNGVFKKENLEKAYENIRRFAALLDISKIDERYIIATSACREATDAKEFIREVEKILNAKVSVISGEEEALLSAEGVIVEMPDAEGVVADLGGGSLELSLLTTGVPKGLARKNAEVGVCERSREITECTSFKLGYHTMLDIELSKGFNPSQMQKYLMSALSEAKAYKEKKVDTLYLVGGRWKRLARLHMASKDYPLKIISNYEVSSAEMKEFLKLDNVFSALRLTALLLTTLLKVTGVKKIVFCTSGIREGYIYSLLKDKVKRCDPLIEAVLKITKLKSKESLKRAKEISKWIESFELMDIKAAYSHASKLAIKIDFHKMIFMSSLLIQAFLFNNKEQKSVAVFDYLINLNLPYLSHPERVFLAYVLFTSLAGNKTNKDIKKYLCLLDFNIQKKAKKIGYLIRLAIYLSPRDSKILSKIKLCYEAGVLRLTSSKIANDDLFSGITLHNALIELENLVEY